MSAPQPNSYLTTIGVSIGGCGGPEEWRSSRWLPARRRWFSGGILESVASETDLPDTPWWTYLAGYGPLRKMSAGYRDRIVDHVRWGVPLPDAVFADSAARYAQWRVKAKAIRAGIFAAAVVGLLLVRVVVDWPPWWIIPLLPGLAFTWFFGYLVRWHNDRRTSASGVEPTTTPG